MVNQEKEKYSERLKNYLNSNTPGAKITTIALCILAVASTPILIIGAGAIGNAIQVFRMFDSSKKYSKRQIQNTFSSLKEQKLIEYICEKNRKTVIKITKKGKSRLRAFDIELMEIKTPKNWDKKWRLVMFDIPVRFSKGREALRYHLKNLNFIQFQKSAWIFPHPCEDEIIFIADFFGVGKFVEILTVENISKDEKFRKYFDL